MFLGGGVLCSCLVSQHSHEACRHLAQLGNEDNIWLAHVDFSFMAVSAIQHSTSIHPSNVSISQSYGQYPATSEPTGV